MSRHVILFSPTSIMRNKDSQQFQLQDYKNHFLKEHIQQFFQIEKSRRLFYRI